MVKGGAAKSAPISDLGSSNDARTTPRSPGLGRAPTCAAWVVYYGVCCAGEEARPDISGLAL